MDGPVLLTGWKGRVGQAILEDLDTAYDWRLLDRDPPTEDVPGEPIVADITDRDAVREATRGVRAVVHLAGDSRREAPWDSLIGNNIDGTQGVFEAAAREGVEKVVFASSNHAVGAYESTERTPGIYRTGDDFILDGEEPARPGNLYGVSKVVGEVLGRYYHDTDGLQVACVRIGNLTKNRPPRDYERGQAMWLSHRDCAHLFDRCLQAEYEYEVVYGISDNDRRYYSTARAKDVLGYEPQDNSAEHE